MHKSMTPPRDYPGLIKPICMMAVDYPSMRDKVFARYPYLRSTYFERRMLFERSSDRMASPVMNVPEFPFERTSIVPRS